MSRNPTDRISDKAWEEVIRRREESDKRVDDREEDPDKQHVYFIQAGERGPVKIGIALNVKKRLAALQTGHSKPLTVRAIITEGGRAKERELHTKLRRYRLSGEWYNPSREVLEEIREAEGAEAFEWLRASGLARLALAITEQAKAGGEP